MFEVESAITVLAEPPAVLRARYGPATATLYPSEDGQRYRQVSFDIAVDFRLIVNGDPDTSTLTRTMPYGLLPNPGDADIPWRIAYFLGSQNQEVS